VTESVAERQSSQRKGANIVLNARRAARKVAADVMRVNTNKMTETARHKHLERAMRMKQQK
jgi:hypothetical protein